MQLLKAENFRIGDLYSVIYSVRDLHELNNLHESYGDIFYKSPMGQSQSSRRQDVTFIYICRSRGHLLEYNSLHTDLKACIDNCLIYYRYVCVV